MRILNNLMISGTHGKPILLDVYHLADDTPKPTVIFAHGFKGFKDWGHWHLIAEQFALAGFIFIKFNFSHNGTTPEDPTAFGDLEAFGNNNFSIELDDLRQIIDMAAAALLPIPDQEILPGEIALIGHSRGGGVTILKAAEDTRVRQLVTWASVSDFSRYWPAEQRKEWQKRGVQYIANARTGQQMPLYWQLYENYDAHRQRFDVSAAAGRLNIPYLIVHGSADHTVPLAEAHTLKSCYPRAELLAIDDADHTFGGRHPWTAETLAPAAQQLVAGTVAFLKSTRSSTA